MRKSDRWYNRIPRDSKCCDRKANRTITLSEMIDTEWCIMQQIIQGNRCHYCNIFLDWFSRKKRNGLTVERLDSSLPHHKNNCVLACHHCNCSRIDRRPDREIMRVNEEPFRDSGRRAGFV